MNDILETIAAITTPPGKGGISVVKVSGNKAFEIAQKCFKYKGNALPDLVAFDRQILYGYVVDPLNDTVIDECILLVMKGPKSYTGEDVVEFQCHGGSISSYKMITLLLSLGVRQAAPGEFTLRAFLNGKKDLIQAEAINALVVSTNEFLHKNAILQIKGDFSKKLEGMFEKLRSYLVSLEADINFPEDVAFDDVKEAYILLEELKDHLIKLQNTYIESRPLREGIKAVILGRPNVGKSTFLNAILDYERAIVTPHPGTTRDFISEQINFCGLPLNIIDTAGIRDTQDPIEKKGIEKTLSLLLEADVVFLILDASVALTKDDEKLIEMIMHHKKRLVFSLLNKIDKAEMIDETKLPSNFFVAKVSLKRGDGINLFKELFRKHILEFYRLDMKEDFYITIPRHFEIVKNITNIIDTVLSDARTKDKLLFALKDILACYDNLIGRETPLDEIEQIFSNFCIGK